MKRIPIRKAALPILVLAMACAVTVYFVFFATRYYSDPAVPYGPPTYPLLTDLSRNEGEGSDLLKSIKAEWHPNSATGAKKVPMTRAGQSQYPAIPFATPIPRPHLTVMAPVELRRHRIDTPQNVIHFPLDGSGEFGRMTFRIEAIGVRDFANDLFAQVPRMVWYGPNLRVLSAKEIAKIPGSNVVGARIAWHPFPAYYISLQVKGAENLGYLGSRFVDPRNQAILGASFSGFVAGDHVYFWVDYPPWRPLPLRLDVDLGYGVDLSTEIAATSGTLFQIGKIKGMLVAVLPGTGIGIGKGLPSFPGLPQRLPGENTLYWASGFTKPDKRTSLLLAAPLENIGTRFKVETIDPQGELKPTLGYAEDYGLCVKEAHCPIGQIQSIRISVRPKTLRLSIDLPTMPGLPPENATVTDLFDLRLPIVAYSDPNSVIDVISRTTGFHISHTLLSFGGGAPGQVFLYSTPREQLDRLRAAIGPAVRWEIDNRKREIRITASPQTARRPPGLFTRIRLFFRRLFF